MKLKEFFADFVPEVMNYLEKEMNYITEEEMIKTIEITKTSSVDEWHWKATINEKVLEQKRDSYNWGNHISPASLFIIKILREITGVDIDHMNSYSGYSIGKNRIKLEYIEGVTYNSKLYTPKEVSEYIKATVKAIREKVISTEAVEFVSFKI